MWAETICQISYRSVSKSDWGKYTKWLFKVGKFVQDNNFIILEVKFIQVNFRTFSGKSVFV